MNDKRLWMHIISAALLLISLSVQVKVGHTMGNGYLLGKYLAPDQLNYIFCERF